MSMRLIAALNHIVARLLDRAATYFFLFGCWFVILWLLSSGNPSVKHTGEIPHLDKLAHFIYFYVGGALLTIGIGLQWQSLSDMRLFLIVVIICSLIGRLDEYHQSYVPGRTGNDIGDWIADTAGGLCGCAMVLGFLLSRFTPRICKRAAE